MTLTIRFPVIPVIIVSILGVGIYLFAMGGSADSVAFADNVKITDGKQIIDLRAKGGYQPRKSSAKAGMPTVLRVNTYGTFDCSSSVRIPSLHISKSLPPTGATDIDLGVAVVGKLKGSCGMGMYPFEIDFQS